MIEIDEISQEKSVSNVVAAVIKEGKEFFIAQRNRKKDFGLKWEFPGGKFEQDEDASQCLIREIKEELELDVYTGEPIGEWIFDHGDVVVRLHVLECFVKSGRIELHVHDQVKWCDGPDEVDWLGPDREIAEAISARLQHHPSHP